MRLAFLAVKVTSSLLHAIGRVVEEKLRGHLVHLCSLRSQRSMPRLVSRKVIHSASAVIALLALSTFTHAIPVLGGTTFIAIEEPAFTTLTSLFTVGAIAPASCCGIMHNPNILYAQVPITSGDTNSDIYLSGGLTLTGSATPRGVGTELAMTDLVFNNPSSILTGTVSVNGGSPVTDVALLFTNSPHGAIFESALANELIDVYGIADLTGTHFGTVTLGYILPAPEPSEFGLFSIGFLISVGFLRIGLKMHR